MVRNQRTSLLEMRQHKFFLGKLCDKLVRAIQDTEDSTALRVRAMLQQQDTLTNIIDILEYSNKKRIQQLQSELQEWEDKEESKINCLELQVEQLNAKVEKTQEEVNFLSTYMDHEYPVRSVQIANLARQLQQAKDDQQDELDNLAEMRRMALELLSTKIWKKKEKILRSLAMRTLQPHEEALLQKTQDSQYRQRCRGTVTEMHPRHGRGPQPSRRRAPLLEDAAAALPLPSQHLEPGWVHFQPESPFRPCSESLLPLLPSFPVYNDFFPFSFSPFSAVALPPRPAGDSQLKISIPFYQ
ncbi:uncharacterized protein C20orf96 homolog isoform X3 [Marmota monax]|nr:uncharacterized protein C20orf96 homolog isoform X3 [Marmota monax]